MGAVAAAVGMSVAACGGGVGLQTSDHGSPTTITTTRGASNSVATTLPPQSGYRGVEDFCASGPLTGAIHYNGTSGRLTGVLAVSVGGLPPDDEVFVNWSNDHVRVPVIASFETDSKGTAIQSSVDLLRLGEVRGMEIVLSAARIPNPVLGRLEPC